MNLIVNITTAALIILGMFLGGALGSAFFCLVKRKQAGVPWADSSRSHCDSCGRTLTFIDLIPVLSYIFLRGKCRTCKSPIPKNGFRVEVIFALAIGAIVASVLHYFQDTAIITAVTVIAVIACCVSLYVETREPENQKKN